jgi:hypothetical protein
MLFVLPSLLWWDNETTRGYLLSCLVEINRDIIYRYITAVMVCVLTSVRGATYRETP